MRGIRVMVEFDMPGHARSWCVGYPDICPSTTCLTPLDPSNNATFDLIEGFLSEVTGMLLLPRLFLSPSLFHCLRDMLCICCGRLHCGTCWLGMEPIGGQRGQGLFFEDLLHLGGDEVDMTCWAQTPHIQQWLTAHNYTTDDAYMYFVERAHDIAIAQGTSHAMMASG